jgi:hypothetical protein
MDSFLHYKSTVSALLIQGGSNMTGTNCDLFTHNQSRSYLNHLVFSVPGRKLKRIVRHIGKHGKEAEKHCPLQTKCNNHDQTNPPLVPFLSQTNAVRRFLSHFLMIHI